MGGAPAGRTVFGTDGGVVGTRSFVHSGARASVAARGVVESAGDPNQVVINEIQLSNRFTALDDRGRTPPWVELHNPGPARVELGGWFLSNDATEPKRWRFPAVTLEPGAYRLVWLSGKKTAPQRSSSQLRYQSTLVGPHDTWRYWAGQAARRGLPSGWWTVEFDDSSFSDGFRASVTETGMTPPYCRAGGWWS